MKKGIQTDLAPKAIGPYQQAILATANTWVFTAGQLGIDPNSNAFVSETIEGQTEQALKNLQAVLRAAGSDLSQVVKTTVFLRDMEDFAAMNAVYARFFADNSPARSAVQVARLPKDARVEIEAIAQVN
ncbi:MAG TPA: RidA family protein [bacterium]|jgi:2-iminobutanoate/2-iminopropanoate deaminase|nr:RidA family protein [bacterium]HNT64880.1 RidA family protein [bacterium]